MSEFNYPECVGKNDAPDTGCDFHPVHGIRAMSLPNRPRERLCSLGPEALSDHELLAILLNTGTRGKNVIHLAADLLKHLDGNKGIPTSGELTRLTGLGKSKAAAVIAMLEFGRRRWGAAGIRIRRPEDIYALIRHYADRRQERFLSLSFNGAHEVLAVRVITVGLVNRTIIHPREVYAEAITDHAVAIAVAHNHPSGQLVPSQEDDEVTSRLRAAGVILGINFLDHIIFSHMSYFSYRQNGRMETDNEGLLQKAKIVYS
ncbi:MAG: DNA repair protein RadC [Treponema sp.]|jgi:DNA repair protein RadC|nr:DNA repair protein RadC [Treponema sp.]